ncbi:MAG: DMT family transporter [Cyclobacteriaceae bacterium]|nr:DMT family transporter [Cyclobacteriaceae bacterium]
MRSKGVLYMFLATFFFAIMNVLVKLLPNIPSVEIVFFRSFISLVISFSILSYKQIPLFGNNKKLLIARGAAGAVGLILYFYTIQKIPLASAVTLQFLAPVFTAILGVFLMKEKVSVWQWFFFLISFGGVLMVQGFDVRISSDFLLIGVVAALFAGLAYNIIRKIGHTEHPLVIVFYFPLVTMPITGVVSSLNWVMPVGVEWFILLAVGIVVQVAQYLLTMAYQAEEVNKIASIKYFGIVYALIFGWIFFNESYTWIVYSGMVVVISGVLLNFIYKSRVMKSL